MVCHQLFMVVDELHLEWIYYTYYVNVYVGSLAIWLL